MISGQIIEEIEERLSEDEIAHLLEIITTTLPDITAEQTDHEVQENTEEAEPQ